MKPTPNPDVERYRIILGPYGSNASNGNNGAFIIPYNKIDFTVLVSDGMGWEHVSVSISKINRSPTWDEMCYFKNLFWDKDEVVVQYHPAEKDYINLHPYALHMWKPTKVEIPTPPSIMVGWKPKKKKHKTYMDDMMIKRY